MDEDRLAQDIGRVADLREPVRRELFLYVVRQPHAVSRDEAAAAVGVSRALAAFHLDKLVAAELLEADYQRLSGRTGPGAGRPSKVYRRGPREIEISVPQRDYQLLAAMLAEAVGRDASRKRLLDQARARGVSTAESVRSRSGRAADAAALTDAAVGALDELGFEPRADEDGIRLMNCPFRGVAQEFPDLVCAANLAMVSGLTQGVGAGMEAVPCEPGDGCCVALVREGRTPAA